MGSCMSTNPAHTMISYRKNAGKDYRSYGISGHDYILREEANDTMTGKDDCVDTLGE